MPFYPSLTGIKTRFCEDGRDLLPLLDCNSHLRNLTSSVAFSISCARPHHYLMSSGRAGCGYIVADPWRLNSQGTFVESLPLASESNVASGEPLDLRTRKKYSSRGSLRVCHVTGWDHGSNLPTTGMTVHLGTERGYGTIRRSSNISASTIKR
jgi:hypothetical protein